MAIFYYRLKCNTEGLQKSGFDFPALTSTDINTPPAEVCPTNGGHTVAAGSLTLIAATGQVVADQTITGTADMSGGSLLLPQGTGTAPVASGSAFFKTDTTTISVGDGTSARAVVDTTGTQTLTNKTLTTPTISSFTNATHTHINAAGGGQLDHTTALTNVGTNTHAQIDTGLSTSASHIAATAAHGATGAVVGTTNTQTLTGKTLTTPVIGDFTSATHAHTNAAGGGQLDHTTALTNVGTNTHATIDSHIAATAAHGATGAVVGTTNTQTLTNKTVNDSTFTIQDEADNTKKLQLQVSPITTGTTRTLTVPDANTTIVGTDVTQTLTNKTLTTPTIGDFTNAQHAHTGATSGGTIAYGSLTSRSHVFADTTGLGADHTTSGLTTGQVLMATGATTAVFQSRTFTINAVILSPSATADYMVWRAPFACTVTAVRGYRVGGTSASVTAGSSPAASVVITNFATGFTTASNTGTWDSGTVTSSAVASTNNVWVRITAISGTATQLCIQIDMTRP